MTTLTDGFYWAKLDDTSDWAPAKFEADRWTLIGNRNDTFPSERMHSIGGEITPVEWALVVPLARVLCDRLSLLELGSDGDGISEDFRRGVEPVAASLRNALDITEAEPVRRSRLLDARQLTYLQNMLVNTVIPMAEAEPLDGDFTITLKIKRNAGKALVDANLAIPSKQARS